MRGAGVGAMCLGKMRGSENLLSHRDLILAYKSRSNIGKITADITPYCVYDKGGLEEETVREGGVEEPVVILIIVRISLRVDHRFVT